MKSLRVYWLGVFAQNVALAALLYLSVMGFRPLLLDDAFIWHSGGLFLSELREQLHLISKPRCVLYLLCFFSWLSFSWFWRLQFYQYLNERAGCAPLQLLSYFKLSIFRLLRSTAILSGGILFLKWSFSAADSLNTVEQVAENWLSLLVTFVAIAFYWLTEVACELLLLNGSSEQPIIDIIKYYRGSWLQATLLFSLRAALLLFLLAAQFRVLNGLSHPSLSQGITWGSLPFTAGFYLALAIAITHPLLKEMGRAFTSYKMLNLSSRGYDDKEADNAG